MIKKLYPSTPFIKGNKGVFIEKMFVSVCGCSYIIDFLSLVGITI